MPQRKAGGLDRKTNLLLSTSGMLGKSARRLPRNLECSTEGIGKMSDNEGLKIVGRTFKDAPLQPLKEAAKDVTKK